MTADMSNEPMTQSDPNPYVEGSHEYEVWLFGYRKGLAEARATAPQGRSMNRDLAFFIILIAAFAAAVLLILAISELMR